MLFLALSLSLLAQTPEPMKFKAGDQEISYLRSGDPDVTGVLMVLPAQPDKPEQEWDHWTKVAAIKKWGTLMPLTLAPGDAGVLLLDKLVTEVRKHWTSPPIYIVGAGPLSPLVFYIASRAPHLMSAGLAIGGSPKPAIETDRMYAANTELAPLIWAATPQDKAASVAAYQQLITAHFNLQVLESPTTPQALDALARYKYQPYPLKIDCETGNPAVSRCYWITPTQFDPSMRNDALLTSKIAPEAQASLDFGAFGYEVSKPGPGVLVEFLPPDYKGPLKLNDRIVQLSGKNIIDAKHYVELLSQVTEEKPVSVTIERGTGKEKERMRLLTRYQLRKRQEVITARIQAFYTPEAKEIAIASRTVSEARITVPPQWAPVSINWNGTPVANPQNPGCYVVSLKNPGTSRPCSGDQ